MIKNYETKILKINMPLRGHAAGSAIRVKTQDGLPVDVYWRRRLKDAEIDSCVEFEKAAKEPTKKIKD
jgi:hypothetical protein